MKYECQAIISPYSHALHSGGVCVVGGVFSSSLSIEKYGKRKGLLVLTCYVIYKSNPCRVPRWGDACQVNASSPADALDPLVPASCCTYCALKSKVSYVAEGIFLNDISI